MSYNFVSQKKAGSVLPFSFVLSTFSVVGKEELLSLELRVTFHKSRLLHNMDGRISVSSA